MTTPTSIRTRSAAALLALVVALAAPVNGTARDPAPPAAAASGKYVAPTPEQWATYMQKLYSPKLDGELNHKLLAALWRKNLASSQLGGPIDPDKTFVPIHIHGAAAEIENIVSHALRSGVATITLAPSTNEDGGRTCDMYYTFTSGETRRSEVTAITGQPKGTISANDLHRAKRDPGPNANANPTSRGMRGGIRSKTNPRRGKLTQLESKMRDALGMAVPVGGAITLSVRTGGRTTEDLAEIEAAAEVVMRSYEAEASVKAIEFSLTHGPLWIWERNPNGGFTRLELTREQIEDERGNASWPTDAARQAAGEALRAGAAPAAPLMATPGMTTAAPALDGDLGGIDLSSLELRYVSDVSTDRTRAAGFAFKALPGDGRTGATAAGAPAANRASEAFFVFLALDPRTFTVNLNPDQPDRIVDEELGRTNAGRVLLEADLRMKKAVAPLIHPNGRLGRRYWSALERIVGTSPACFSFRQWIVPAEATVYESDGELYILKAPLSVKLESDYLSTPGAAQGPDCPSPGSSAQTRIEDVYRRLILPRVQRAVRRAPEFAALRRVYFSRVAAEWYRARVAARKGAAFAAIVDSGDVSPWRQTRSWTPRDVFDRYVRSYKEGEFDVSKRVRSGNLVGTRTYVYGGVDFSAIPRRSVSRSELAAMRPGLSRRISGALTQPAIDPRSGEVWLAGASFDRAAAADDPAFRPSGDGGGVGIAVPIVALLAVLSIALLAYITRLGMRRIG